MSNEGIARRNSSTQFVRLASLIQKQDVPIDVQIDEQSFAHLEGGLDLLIWRDIKLMLAPIQTALVRAELVQPELISCNSVVFQDQTGWSVSLSLDGDTSTGVAYDLPRISTLIDAVVAGLVNGAAGRHSGSLMVNDEDNVAIVQVIKETLTQNGGKRLTSAIKLQCHMREYNVVGKLSPKLSLANFHPEKTVLSGRFCGFNTDRKELTFVVGKSPMQISYEPNLVDLIEITRACKDNRHAEIQTQRTVDRSGQFVYAYLPEAPFRV